MRKRRTAEAVRLFSYLSGRSVPAAPARPASGEAVVPRGMGAGSGQEPYFNAFSTIRMALLRGALPREIDGAAVPLCWFTALSQRG